MEKYIMALDQGTTSSRCILFDKGGNICSMAQKEFTQIYPKPGWVEHNPVEIWSSQLAVLTEAMAMAGADGEDICGIGITNQRETTIVWDKETGEPVYNAIVWQCRRTAPKIDELVAAGYGEMIRERTGLVPDAYFSGTKIAWILDNVPGAREVMVENEYVFTEPEGMCGTWKEVFGNDNPIHIEIGMGKGTFITTLAGMNPDINYVGIEKYSSVLLRAVEKQDELQLPNLRFIRMDAENINEVFGVDEVDRIYLNFSDPWPKDRHAKRRLTSRQFFARYDKMLKKEGRVEFKTDNRVLFDFSVEEVKEAGWNLVECTYDLHSDERLNEGNVMTEYEKKFSDMGNPICKLIADR